MTPPADAAPHTPPGSPPGAPAHAGPTLTLRVAEAASRDVGRAIARMDADAMRALGVSAGDAVAVAGTRTTVCRVMRAVREQAGPGRVCLDGVTRANAGAALDENVSVARAECAPARSVVLAADPGAPAPRDDGRRLADLLDGLTITAGDRVRAALFAARPVEFTVHATTPAGPVILTRATRVTVQGAAPAAGAPARPGVSYEDVGGLKPQLGRIREMIELPLRYPEIFQRLGVEAPRGVLLHGPPGCGKTLIARAIAHETAARFYTVSGPEIIHKFYGESEAHLRKVWDEASRNAPSIIFLDEIDSIAPRRENTAGEVEKRVVAQLLALMDGLQRRSGVVVIAATNLPDSLDPALRRPGRFDREIVIPVPDRNARRHILDIHSRGMPLAPDVDLDHLADVTHGCVGADLEALCREAAMACLRTVLDRIDFSCGEVPDETLRAMEVAAVHFAQARAEIVPSALRDAFVEVPDVSWDDIGGLEDVKRRLIEAVEWPLTRADLFERAGVRPPRGVLLAGPPGVGKTLLARAVASRSRANFLSIKGPELLSRYVGESERGVRDLFRKARRAAPCVVFLDEADALLPRRAESASDGAVAARVLAQFLAEMDGVEEVRGVLVLAATNRLDMLDPAVLRPGRFDEIVSIGPPDPASREAIFRVHLRRRPTAPDVDPAALARATEGLSGAQIAAACRSAAMAALRRAVASEDAPIRIAQADLLDAVREAGRA